MIEEKDIVFRYIEELTNPATREQALLELSKKRESYDDLAPILWHSFGVMAALLQEIVSVYGLLTPPTLTGHSSNRVCNALALMQCLASHQETRQFFLQAHIPLFLYPFLNTTNKTRPFEYLRLTSLGVIGALVKVLLKLRFRTIMQTSSTFYYPQRLFHCVCALWRLDLNFLRQLPSS